MIFAFILFFFPVYFAFMHLYVSLGEWAEVGSTYYIVIPTWALLGNVVAIWIAWKIAKRMCLLICAHEP
jgi:hypothetical protein